MGIKGTIGKMLPGISSARAAAYIDNGGKTAQRFMKQGQKLMDAGAMPLQYKGIKGPMSPSRMQAETLRDYAIRKRQVQVGTRYALGAGAMAGMAAMRPNANQSRTSYRGPGAAAMRTPPGSGRYA